MALQVPARLSRTDGDTVSLAKHLLQCVAVESEPDLLIYCKLNEEPLKTSCLFLCFWSKSASLLLSEMMRREGEKYAIMLPDFTRESVEIFLEFLLMGKCDLKLSSHLYSEIIQLLNIFQVQSALLQNMQTSFDLKTGIKEEATLPPDPLAPNLTSSHQDSVDLLKASRTWDFICMKKLISSAYSQPQYKQVLSTAAPFSAATGFSVLSSHDSMWTMPCLIKSRTSPNAAPQKAQLLPWQLRW